MRFIIVPLTGKDRKIGINVDLITTYRSTQDPSSENPKIPVDRVIVSMRNGLEHRLAVSFEEFNAIILEALTDLDPVDRKVETLKRMYPGVE